MEGKRVEDGKSGKEGAHQRGEGIFSRVSVGIDVSSGVLMVGIIGGRGLSIIRRDSM